MRPFTYTVLTRKEFYLNFNVLLSQMNVRTFNF
jgi:hypothetical protein